MIIETLFYWGKEQVLLVRYRLAKVIGRFPSWVRLSHFAIGRPVGQPIGNSDRLDSEWRCAIARCKGAIVATIVGSGCLLTTNVSANESVPVSPSVITIAQNQATSTDIVVGVVQSRDNLANWPTIIARLNRANIAYQVIDWEASNRLSDFSQFSILLLPNIEQVSRRQSHALQEFVEQGGELIITGAFGTEASSSIQQRLRSLVGAYWANDLPTPSRLRPSSHRLHMGNMGSTSVVQGGVLMPMGLRSRTLATWEESVEVSLPDRPNNMEIQTQGAPAVVTTTQTTFLGWDWGSGDADTALDSAWMALAFNLSMAEADPQNALSATTTENSRPTGPTASRPTENGMSEGVNDGAIAQRQPEINNTPNLPQSSDTESTDTELDTSASATDSDRPTQDTAPLELGVGGQTPVPPPPPFLLPANPASSRVNTDEFDPAEQTAPPGLDIGEGALPISVLEAIAMEQELKNVMGRFESALLSANAAAYPTSLQPQSLQNTNATPQNDAINADEETVEQPPVLVASAGGTLDAATARAAQASYDILQQAEMLGDRFSAALENQDYAAAREHWLQARRLLWDNFPRDRPIYQTEIRAIWFDRGSIVAARDRRGLAELFDRLAAAGINTIFFETVNAGYPIYPSAIAPEQNPLIPQYWDPLADAVDLAHERGMELHAWVWAFAAGNQRHNTLVNLPHSYPGPLLETHPNWANYDNSGQMIPPGQTKPFLDPANPQVRNYLRRLFTEIVTEYDVDGLQLDYIRYPFQDPGAGRHYGYGQAARRQFQRQTGVDPVTIGPSDRPLWDHWTEFRTQQIDSFISDISTHLRQRRPDLLLSAAVFPLSHHERMQKLQQNWERWAQRGEIDLIVPMSYAMDTNRLQQLTTPWLTDPANDVGAALVLPGIRLLNLPDNVAIDQIQSLRDLPAGGYALFAVENLADNPNLQAIFSQTQGVSAVTAPPIPHRQPFHTAAARFASLNQQWNYLLDGDRLWMRDSALAEWYRQSQLLQTSLQQLAQHPSQENLDRANTNFQQYQAQFDQWMALHALENSYRVQTWSYHLDAIQQLLDYGNQQLSRAN